jgi:aminoglycoside phosphotransferase family enzyme/predicted kinase
MAIEGILEPIDPSLVDGLEHPEAYPDDASALAGVAHVQTHLSHVFLSGSRAYKLRKAVRFDFVDFGTRAERGADCLREVALNRRLAPDVYLGVAPVRPTPDGVRVGRVVETLTGEAEANAPEHCVVMRRLPDGRDALTGLVLGWLDGVRLDAVARMIASFHALHGLGSPAPFAPSEWRHRIEAPMQECFAVLDSAGLDPDHEALGRRAAERARLVLDEHWPCFDERRKRGCAVDAHGDLHLQHVWFESDESDPIAIDCIEFRDDYRHIDRASEVAFLAMDLAYRGRRDLAERFLRTYAALADDFDLYRVVDYFMGYRAAVRAKVAALAATDPAIAVEQRRRAARSAAAHLELAAAWLEPAARGGIVALCGRVGTGKSSAAAELADRTNGVVITSDRVRKRLAGLAPTDRRGQGDDSGLYSPARTREVYRGLRERALPVVESGRIAVLDATFARRELRDELRRWADAQGLRVFLVETRCEAGRVLERLARRAAEGRDPSDAGPEFYLRSAADYEAPLEWPERDRIQLSSDLPGWSGQLDGLAARLGERASETKP